MRPARCESRRRRRPAATRDSSCSARRSGIDPKPHPYPSPLLILLPFLFSFFISAASTVYPILISPLHVPSTHTTSTTPLHIHWLRIPALIVHTTPCSTYCLLFLYVTVIRELFLYDDDDTQYKVWSTTLSH
ncbi:hypothetical protein DFH09DRAFT_395347, partial [Mycena vulgaris]